MFDKNDQKKEIYDFPSNSLDSKPIISGVIALFLIALVVTGALYLSKNNKLADSEKIDTKNNNILIDDNESRNIEEKDINIINEVQLQNIDSDGDGLMDDEEEFYGTNINRVDSDGDGYSDLEEINKGYNPLGEGKLVVPKKPEKKEVKEIQKKIKKVENKIITERALPKKNLNDFIDYSFDKIKSFFSISGIISLFFKLLLFILRIAIFATLLKFVLRRFFAIIIDIEKALFISSLQTISYTVIGYIAGIATFFTTDLLSKLPIYLFSICLGFFVYHLILKYFLQTSVWQNVGIIISTGIIMFLITILLSVVIGILLIPLVLIFGSVFGSPFSL